MNWPSPSGGNISRSTRNKFWRGDIITTEDNQTRVSSIILWCILWLKILSRFLTTLCAYRVGSDDCWHIGRKKEREREREDKIRTMSHLVDSWIDFCYTHCCTNWHMGATIARNNIRCTEPDLFNRCEFYVPHTSNEPTSQITTHFSPHSSNPLASTTGFHIMQTCSAHSIFASVLTCFAIGRTTSCAIRLPIHPNKNYFNKTGISVNYHQAYISSELSWSIHFLTL